MNEVAKVSSRAPSGAMVEPAGHDSVVFRVDELWAFRLLLEALLLVLLLKSVNQLLEKVNRFVMTLNRLPIRADSAKAHLSLMYHSDYSSPLTYREAISLMMRVIK